MRTTGNSVSLAEALFGKTRRMILSFLYTHSDDSFYLRQIARATGASLGAMPRELKILTDAGIITRRVQGNQVHFQANRECPIFRELKSIIIKTAGVADVLRDALAPLEDRIKLAFIYGSFAKGDERATSDVDVIIVGDMKSREAISALRPSYEVLGREVNPSCFSVDEFRKRLKKGDHFLDNVNRNPKIYLFGDDREIRKLGK